MADYYNEIDPFAAAWLRELMKAGQIPDGEVDERSIELVQPDDVRGFRQCHFFAGIGGWALALRLAGWPDDLGVWTGSCPCQPFSSAGAQAGGHDPRDLWPVWFQLIAECRPVVVFGEQVEAAIGHGWLDRLCDDLEAEDYAIGACGLPGPCVGAFDIRHRLWFVADAEGAGGWPDARSTRQRAAESLRGAEGQDERRAEFKAGHVGDRSAIGAVADCAINGRREERQVGRGVGARDGAQGWTAGSKSGRAAGALADAGQRECDKGSDRHSGAVSTERGISTTVDQRCRAARELGITPGSGRERQRDQSAHGEPMQASPWSDVEWLPCSDGKARPVEPGTFPLAHGVSARVGRLRGYGNAIKPQVAQVFIESYLAARGIQ